MTDNAIAIIHKSRHQIQLQLQGHMLPALAVPEIVAFDGQRVLKKKVEGHE